MARSRQTSKLQRATEADVMDLLRSIHGEPDGQYVDKKLWSPRFKHKDTLPRNIKYYDSNKSVNFADRLVVNRDGPDEIPGRAWRSTILHGLINAQLRAYALDWFTSTEMVAMTILLLSTLPFVARDSQFGGTFNEAAGLSKSFSAFTINQILKGARLAVFGGVRDAGTNCPHWYVMMVDIPNQVVYFFDSLTQLQPLPSHQKALDHLVTLWTQDITSQRSDLPPPTKAKVVRLSMQEDGWSCGLRCAINIALILFKPKTALELFRSKKFTREEEMDDFVEYLSVVTRWKVPKNWVPPVPQLDQQPPEKKVVKDSPKNAPINSTEQGRRRSARLSKAAETEDLPPATPLSTKRTTRHQASTEGKEEVVLPSIEEVLSPEQITRQAEYEIIPFTPINKPRAPSKSLYTKQVENVPPSATPTDRKVIKKMPNKILNSGTFEDLTVFMTQLFSYYDRPIALTPPTQPSNFRREVDVNNTYLPVSEAAIFFSGAVNPMTNQAESYWSYDFGRHFINAAMRIARHSWWNEDEVSAVLRVFLEPFSPNGRLRPTTLVERRFGDFVGGHYNDLEYRDSTFDEQVLNQQPEIIVFGRHRENHWYSIVVDRTSRIAYVFNSLENEHENLQEDLQNIQTGYQSRLPGLEPPHTIISLPSILQTSNWECGPLTVLTLIYVFTDSAKLYDMFSSSKVVVGGPTELSELQNLLLRYVGVRLVGTVSRYSEPPVVSLSTQKKLLPSRFQPNAPKPKIIDSKSPKTPRQIRFSDEITSPSSQYKGIFRSGAEDPSDHNLIIPEMNKEPKAFQSDSDSGSDIFIRSRHSTRGLESDSDSTIILPEKPSSETPKPPKRSHHKPHPPHIEMKKYYQGSTIEDIMSLNSVRERDIEGMAREILRGEVAAPYRWPGESWLDLASRPEPSVPREWKGWAWYRAQLEAVRQANAVPQTPKRQASRRNTGPLMILDEKGKTTKQPKK
ncbi:hypothetical protein GGS21DRAFT_494458 [Xylaria nigripes]|nr:hypothetical protein GGS21DRAFT_494458 [Xylaria nigripes]